MKPVLPPAGQHASDVFRHIFQIPFIDKPIDLAGLFIAFVRGIGVVDNADKPNAPQREQAVYIPFYKFQLTGKTRLCFA